MSYILDALKKSDQQRHRGGTPSLPSASSMTVVPERPVLFFYAVLAGGLIVVGMLIGWFVPWQPAPSAVPLVVKPREMMTPAVAPVAPVSIPAPLPVMPAVMPVVAPQNQLPAAMPPGPAFVPPVSRQKLPVSARGEVAAVHRVMVAEAPQKAVMNSALPPMTQQQLPPMTVAVHAYSSKPRERLVSINGRMLHEGDALAPDLRLEEITPDGMVFIYRGSRFQRGVQ